MIVFSVQLNAFLIYNLLLFNSLAHNAYLSCFQFSKKVKKNIKLVIALKLF